eukprot:EG_transcript_33410
MGCSSSSPRQIAHRSPKGPSPTGTRATRLPSPASQEEADRAMALSLQAYYAAEAARLRHLHQHSREPTPQQSGPRTFLIKEEVDLLPTFRPTATDVECQICMEDATTHQTWRILPCLHSFHTHCADAWLLRHNTCPACAAVVTIDLDQEAMLERDMREGQTY